MRLARSIFVGISLFTVWTCAANAVTVPFVGCPADGQTDAIPAPKGKSVTIALDAQAASHLAFYASQDFGGILAPRGWHCATLYGSGGWFVIVAQQPITPVGLLASHPNLLKGPAIQLSLSDGGTSGRFEVAQLIARYFPERRAFLKSVIDERIEPANSFPEGPFKTDILVSRHKDAVEYLTPAGKEGLGTKSRLDPSGLPIHAAAALVGGEDEDWAGYVLAVRLPKEQEDLAPVILRWAAATYWETK